MPDRIQIIFICRSLSGGGAERVVYDLCHNLDRTRFEPHVVSLFDQDSPPHAYSADIPIYYAAPTVQKLSPNVNYLTDKFSHSKVYKVLKRFYALLFNPSTRNQLSIRSRLRPTSLLYSIANIWPSVAALQEILATFRQDAILVPVMEEATVRIWLNEIHDKRTVISSLHSVESYNLKMMYPDPVQRQTEEWLFSNACRSAKVVIVPSMGCKEDLVRNFGILPDHIQRLVNPVNIDQILQKSKQQNPVKVQNKKTEFVFVGRLDQDKNPGLLIEAARILYEHYQDFVIYYVGKGALRAELTKKIQLLGLQNHVFLLGELLNPYPLMTRARALILTSHVESFSLVLLEAMVCATVPIAVDCPFGPREILDDGKYGILVPPDDAQVLADAMLRIASDDDLHSSLRKLGEERAKKYEITQVICEWQDLFVNVYHQNHSRNGDIN